MFKKIKKMNRDTRFHISLIKTIIFMILIGIHAFLFGYFLYISYESIFLTLFESIFSIFLVSGTLITFFLKNPYYFYFYIGIVFGTLTVIIIIPISLLIVIPELAFLYILTLRGPSPGQIYSRMKASKQVGLFYHDPAVILSDMAPGYSGLKMNEVWNPDSTKPIIEGERSLSLDKKFSKWKIGVISFISTNGFIITSIMSEILYFL